MYTFNLFPLDSTMNNKSNSELDQSQRLNVENCSINELKAQIAQRFSLPTDSFDVYCQGVQLTGDDKNLNDYEIDKEDDLVIIPKVKMPTESSMATSAGLPGKSELHQSAKTIEISATPNEFHRLYWLMKTPEFWRRITQVLPELLLDSSALGFINGRSESTTIQSSCTSTKEWTSSGHTTSATDVQLSPAAYFLNGSPHLIEPAAPRQPTFNVMPRRITNEDFYRALEQTSRSTTASRPSTIPPSQQQQPQQQAQPQPSRTSNRRNVISMDQLRNALQRATTTPPTTTADQPAPVTTMESTSGEPANLPELLQQMNAMGLNDEAANRQALEAVNWDLKAALDLLLG